jgi:phospholipid/cholesterol/gamma-HCH transport system substrate-binding protein
MAFQVSNETKVGALTAISITLLILGFNFLKGNNPMKKSQYLYAKFPAVEGLLEANPVICNGLVIGNVYKTEPADELMSSILVTIRITENVKIPTDSRAVIKGNLLGTPAVVINKGMAATYFNKGDTIPTIAASGFMSEVLDQLGPTQQKLNNALGGLDTLLNKANGTLDARTQQNIQQSIAHLSTITANLAQATASLNALMKEQNSAITGAIANLEATSRQVKEGTQPLPAIMQNMEKFSTNLSEADIKKIVNDLNGTIASLNTTLAKLNQKDNSIGALMNDKKLYDNLASTTNSLNLLLQDLRLHPKRYVNVSVFGKKDKSEPLMKPMAEDSLTQEQIKQ